LPNCPPKKPATIYISTTSDRNVQTTFKVTFYLSHKSLNTPRGRLEGSTFTPPPPQMHQAHKGERRVYVPSTSTPRTAPHTPSQTSPGPIFFLGWRGRVAFGFPALSLILESSAMAFFFL